MLELGPFNEESNAVTIWTPRLPLRLTIACILFSVTLSTGVYLNRNLVQLMIAKRKSYHNHVFVFPYYD